MRYYIYRYGANAANQPMDLGPCLVAAVEADNEEQAYVLARKRVTCYLNQHLEARLADEVDAEEAAIDERVTLL